MSKTIYYAATYVEFNFVLIFYVFFLHILCQHILIRGAVKNAFCQPKITISIKKETKYIAFKVFFLFFKKNSFEFESKKRLLEKSVLVFEMPFSNLTVKSKLLKEEFAF